MCDDGEEEVVIITLCHAGVYAKRNDSIFFQGDPIASLQDDGLEI